MLRLYFAWNESARCQPAEWQPQEPAASSLFMGSSPHDAAIATAAALVASEMRAKLVVFIPNRWVVTDIVETIAKRQVPYTF